MPSPVRTYHAEMHRNLGFFATWLPGDPIEIGDAGLLVEGRFRRLSSLSELGIRYTQSESTASQNLQYTSTEGTKIDPTIGGAVAGDPHLVAELALGHVQSDKLMQAYQRGDLFEKRRPQASLDPAALLRGVASRAAAPTRGRAGRCGTRSRRRSGGGQPRAPRALRRSPGSR